MKQWRTARTTSGAIQRAAIGLMLVLWLGTFALAACPQLHHWLHEDAQSATHNCLITSVKQQPAPVGPAPALAPKPPLSDFGPVSQAEVWIAPTRDFRQAPSRAPPAFHHSARIAG